MTMTNCSNVLSTTQTLHEKFANQNISIKVIPMVNKSQPEKNELTTEALRKKLQEIYNNHLDRIVDFNHRVMEQKLNKISESVFNPPEQILELFIQSVSQNNCLKILNMSNLAVFWELANAYKIPKLIEDCKNFMDNPIYDPEITLDEWLKGCK